MRDSQGAPIGCQKQVNESSGNRSGKERTISWSEHEALLREQCQKVEERLLLRMARYCGMVESLEQMQRDLMAEFEKARAARSGEGK